jgi:hypothetical protein
MSSTVVATGSPTSRRSLASRSQSQENAAFDDDKPQGRPVSLPSHNIQPKSCLYRDMSALFLPRGCVASMFHVQLRVVSRQLWHNTLWNITVSLSSSYLTLFEQDPTTMLKKSASALSSSKLVNQVPKVSLNRIIPCPDSAYIIDNYSRATD